MIQAKVKKYRSRSKSISQQKGLVQRVAVFKYEVNPFSDKNVMANVRVFEKLDRQGHQGVNVINLYVNLKV